MTQPEAEPLPHEHDLRLTAVDLEDGVTTREFLCAECGAVWFR